MGSEQREHITPSLCTAAAKGDIATVEKHLASPLCNPLTAQYFVDPNVDANSQNAVVGFIKKKRTVYVAPKNSEAGALVRPATPVQVALYYQQDNVLFLLLNHFLNVSKMGVSRIHDETSEAIAQSNGYSSLMEFFQYYDQLNSETVASCWTEAMRHICELTTKYNKLKKQLNDAYDNEAASKEQTQFYSQHLEERKSQQRKLELALKDKEDHIQILQNELNQITGYKEIQELQKKYWTVTCKEGRVFVNETTAEGDNKRITECMRQQYVLLKKLQSISTYLHDLSMHDEIKRVSSVEGVTDIQRDTYDSGLPVPEINTICRLSLPDHELRVFEQGSSMLRELELVQRELEQNTNADEVLEKLMKLQAVRLKHIAEQLGKNGIHADPSVAVLLRTVRLLQTACMTPAMQGKLDDVTRHIELLAGDIHATATQKKIYEESANVKAVEKEVRRQLELRRSQTETIAAKVRMLSSQVQEISAMKEFEVICNKSCTEIEQIIEQREKIADQCTIDEVSISEYIQSLKPEVASLQLKAAEVSARFDRQAAENGALQKEVWGALQEALAKLVALQKERCQLVETRIGEIMELKRQEEAHRKLMETAQQRAGELIKFRARCKGSGDVCRVMLECIKDSKGKLLGWCTHYLLQLDEEKVRAYKLFVEEFKDWYLQQGEYVCKKKLLREDLLAQIEDGAGIQKTAVLRLDSSAEVHADTLRRFQQQERDLGEQIPVLEAALEDDFPMLTEALAFLAGRNVVCKHPKEDLQLRTQQIVEAYHSSKLHRLNEEIQRSKSFITQTTPMKQQLQIVSPMKQPTITPGEVRHTAEFYKDLKLQLQANYILLPQEFLDPITMELMVDPVIAADGFVYERMSIERWLKRKQTSPKTNGPLKDTSLTPDPIMKQKITDWVILQVKELSELDGREQT